MVAEGSRVFFVSSQRPAWSQRVGGYFLVSSQQRGIHKYFVSPKRDILPSRYMEFGKHKFGLYSLLSKRKFPLGFPRTGSCSVQRGQRGTLRQQSRTILSRLTERQGQSTAVRPVRVPPKHERALQRSSTVQASSGLQRLLQLRQSRLLAGNNPVSAQQRRASQSTTRLPRPGKKVQKEVEKHLYFGIPSSRTNSPRTHIHKVGEKPKKKFRGARRAPKTYFWG